MEDRVLIEKLFVNFTVARPSVPGEQMMVVGSHPVIGKGQVGSSQGRMEYANNQWHCRLEFDSVDIISKLVEFNFVIVRNGDNATAEFESIPPRQLYVSYYRMGVNAQWNKSPEIDPKYLETQAQRKKDWLAQAEKLRALREADPDKNAPVANKPAILEEAAKLLELKQLDADWAMIFGAKLIKVRWQFTDAEGQEVRLQLPFPGRTSLSFAEVRKAIAEYMKAKYTSGGIVKVELKTEKDAAGKLTWREIANDEERIRLPLIFPGPLLKSSHAFVFRVQFEVPPKALHQRGKYLGYLVG